MVQALGKEVPMFPDLAVRELVANALIHQDLFLTGTSPMVEIFFRPDGNHQSGYPVGRHPAFPR